MSDASVAAALRSDARLVVIEAPAGCGKTYQAAEYAREAASTVRQGQRILILTHTHAACSVFAARTRGVGSRVQIGTIDSLIVQIATAYHRVLNLPSDVSVWAFAQGGTGFDQLARKVSALLDRSSAICGALASRYPIVICDEHQDANEGQHGVIMAIGIAGSRLIVFADPMQAIYGSNAETTTRWERLLGASNATELLDYPHRWDQGSRALGEWTLEAREMLRQGNALDLRGQLPRGLSIIEADNQAQRHGQYQVSREEGRQINSVTRRNGGLLILSAHNATIRSLNAMWGRTIPIWEGFTRSALSLLAISCRQHAGNANALAGAFCDFIGEIGIGFTPSSFGNRLKQEVQTGCAVRCRGKPALIQRLGLCLLETPDHRGVGTALNLLHGFIRDEEAFSCVKIDLRREFHEALKLGSFDEPEQGYSQLRSQRVQMQPSIPLRAISTIHKAKGLECANALLIPCDAHHFSAAEKNRCLLYVGLSRASSSLTLVLSPTTPTPWIMM
ncbi:ATP-dependent helicase [Pseudomonas sp. MAFF 301449]|uniref:DNA 3'-5' helicase II n=1 Tax=Pseudomonas cyclaminis TaxID=2781239 RepID=A0ABR9SLM0_9PSED|nr:UvrD-helicase domain-containing protein [Pseudomonas cyclaminis]MBE8589812.1 ATP-dependent helicase [Pseudomonas cyclaminis]MBE8598806.1 ATP-dependent helicase [Pseudomonas cyclaminis]